MTIPEVDLNKGVDYEERTLKTPAWKEVVMMGNGLKRVVQHPDEYEMQTKHREYTKTEKADLLRQALKETQDDMLEAFEDMLEITTATALFKFFLKQMARGTIRQRRRVWRNQLKEIEESADV